jgi:hypothetical protein
VRIGGDYGIRGFERKRVPAAHRAIQTTGFLLLERPGWLLLPGLGSRPLGQSPGAFWSIWSQASGSAPGGTTVMFSEAQPIPNLGKHQLERHATGEKLPVLPFPDSYEGVCFESRRRGE